MTLRLHPRRALAALLGRCDHGPSEHVVAISGEHGWRRMRCTGCGRVHEQIRTRTGDWVDAFAPSGEPAAAQPEPRRSLR